MLNICGILFICRTKIYDNNRSQEFKQLAVLTVLQSAKCNKLDLTTEFKDVFHNIYDTPNKRV